MCCKAASRRRPTPTSGASAICSRAFIATRSSACGASGASLRSTPILLLPRRNAALWSRLAPPPVEESALGARAQRVADHLAEHGASFFDEIADGTRLLPTEIEEALGELVMRGRVHCDSYAGLRALLVPPSKRASSASSHRKRR